MRVVIKPGAPAGTVRVPPSKSMMQRALAAALLHRGTTVINNPGSSADDKAALGIIQQLGATIAENTEQRIIIESEGRVGSGETIHCGESGLSARLFIPIAALSATAVHVDGSGSLLQRPMREFEAILPALGVNIDSLNGYLPYTIHGPLVPAPVTIDGGVSSQFLTGILFALSAAAREPVMIAVHSLRSKPYIDMTLEVLSHFGKPVAHTDYEQFCIDPSMFSPPGQVEIDIEGDWSSAAFWLAAGAMNGNITAENLNLNSRQADTAIAEVLQQVRANMTTGETSMSVNGSELRPFQIDASDCPDLFPVLSVLAACCYGTSSIKGLHRLRHKESDRERSINDMLAQLGVAHSTANDELHVTGQELLQSCTINGCNDHRIVMAAAIAAVRCDGPVIVTDAGAVAKSYPMFFDHLASLGIEYALNA